MNEQHPIHGKHTRLLSLTFTCLSLLFLLIITVEKKESPILAVLNRTPNDSMNKTIFMAADFSPNETGNSIYSTGTAYVAKGPRCLITTAHVAIDATDVFMGKDLTNIVDTSKLIKRQAIAKKAYPENMKINPYAIPEDNSYHDFSVLWLESKKDAPNSRGPFHMTNADYVPLQLAKTESLGLDPLPSADPYKQSTGEMFDVLMYGYGANVSIKALNGTYYDEGAQIRRDGIARSLNFILGKDNSSKVSGSKFITIPYYPEDDDEAAKQRPCKGDSGMPLMKDGDSDHAYGTYTRSIKKYGTSGCRSSVLDVYAGFDDINTLTKDGQEETSWTRINKMIKATCTLTGATGKEPTSRGNGKIMGSISPSQAWPTIPGELFNESISCVPGSSTSDCIEAVHYGQTLVLTATPDANSTFVRWTNFTHPEVACPCAEGPSSLTCTLPFTALGYYTESISDDNTICTALFDLKSSSSSSFSSRFASSASSRSTSSRMSTF